MKRILAITCLVLLMVLVGCKTNTNAPTQPLAPGYTNQVDMTLAETLAAARAFYNRLQQDAVAGTFKPSAAETAALNDLEIAINTAEPIYLAYHNGTGNQAAAQTAIANVTQKQTAVSSMISGVQQ